MTRSRMILLGIFALILSAVVTYFIQRELSSRLDLEEEQPGEIVVAKVPLQIGTLLEEDHLKTSPWPEDVPLEGSFEKTDDLIGRGVIFPIQVNEPVLDSKLARKGTGAGLAPSIPEGMRAMAVPVNSVVGVAGFVLPGSRVDVILSGSPEGSRIDYSRTILENIQVLSAGQDVEYDAQGKPKNVPVVTLLVTPEQAQILTLATIDGRIQLVLRNPLDLDPADPDAVRRQALYDKKATSKSPPPPPPPVRTARRSTSPPRPAPVKVQPPEPQIFEVELIEGSNRKTLKFQEKEGTPEQKEKEGTPEQKEKEGTPEQKEKEGTPGQ